MKLFALYEIKIFHPSYEMYPEIVTQIFDSPEARQVRIEAWGEGHEYAKHVTYQPIVGQVVVAEQSLHYDDYRIETSELDLITT